jgi:hypothetical protein
MLGAVSENSAAIWMRTSIPGNKKIRDVVGFTQLTSSTSTYGIYDDHDFGPNDCDGTHRTPPKPLPEIMIHSYGRGDDNNMFGEIEFRPSSDKKTAIIFRSFSTENGLIYEHKLVPLDLGIK